MQAQTVNLTNVDYAINYAAEWHWAVMPLHSVDPDGFCTCGNQTCKSEGKHPRTKNGLKDATADIAQIRQWWDKWPEANIGIATGPISGIAVVDVDSDKGAQHSDLIIGSLGHTVLSTIRVKTGGGMHYYYKYPAAGVKNSANRLGQFIDTRGDGGYVIAPPSLHISGRHYEFWGQQPDDPQLIEKLLDFPQEWIDKLNTAPAASSNGSAQPVTPVAGTNGNGLYVPPPDPGLIVPEQVNSGTRNQTLIKLAGVMRRHGFAEDAIFSALSSENKRVCKPPLDDKEVHDIAHSAGRYAPAETVDPVSDDDAAQADYENTLKPFLYSDFRKAVFEEKEVLGFHIGKRDIAVIQAATNSGKTTLLRNVTLCMTAGRPFMPVYEGVRPIKIAYFDFENDAQDVQRDLAIMEKAFTPEEVKLIGQNLIIIPKGLMNGELFQFNTHEKWANALILDNGVEFIFVDNVSAAYDLNDENSNAEVTKKVIKPLLKMAYKGDCAFVFAHHYGKAKQEIDHAGVHAGRGASALQALSRTVINMFGDVSQGEEVTVECAKRKTDGGQKYREVFRLDPDRWFHHTTFVAPPPKPSAYNAIRLFLAGIIYPKTVTMAEIMEKFEKEYSDSAVEKAVNRLFKFGFIDKPKHGEYCGKGKKKDDPAIVNFYEKDDED